MEKLDLKSKKKVYFIGIGGISMSAIANILFDKGFIIEGSDIALNEEIKKLISYGIKVKIGHKKENITSDIDIVVYSKAIHDDNEEMVAAKEKNIRLLSRSEILGMLMANYNKRICVAGTHGKTTTTSIVSKVLLDKGFNPTINIGGEVDAIGGNYHIGNNKDIFVAEACEYTNSFLDFCPNAIIITNVDIDHLDFFKDLDDIRQSFKKFVELLSDGDLLIINQNISDIKYFYKDKNIKVITYGDNENADYYFKSIKYDDAYNMCFDAYHKNERLGTVKQKLIGKHNALNFIAACAMLMENGIDFKDIIKSVDGFTGAKRRLELKGEINGITFIDDYAHHPAEIEASLNALKGLKCDNMYLIFQPHTYTRTKALLSDFARVLSCFDHVILTKIYAAREKDLGIISSKDVQTEIIKHQVNKNNIPEYFETFEKIIEYLINKVRPNDVIVTMGAGDIYKIYDMFMGISNNVVVEGSHNKNNLQE